MNIDVDVVVAGAGPTGLMLAGDLARTGVRALVLERRAERSGLTGYGDHVDTVEADRPTGIVALIRPDAYVAWAQGPAGTGDRATQIRDALARWCGK